MDNILDHQVLTLVEKDEFNYYDEDDSFIYHVTSVDSAKKILEYGFDTSEKMFGSAYDEHSNGRVFFTEKSGVMYWTSRIEDRLFDKHDDPPEVIVLKIPKNAIGSLLLRDEIGSWDAKHEAYFANQDQLNLVLSAECEAKLPLRHVKDQLFFEWFNGSKVVDEQGLPLLLFHGTNADFAEFNISPGWFGDGAYFTDDPEVASDYVYEDEEGGNVIPVYLRLENPYIFKERITGEASNVQMMRALGLSQSKIAEALLRGEADELLRSTLESKGFDGVIAQLIDDPIEYVAFYPNQIRFAVAHEWNQDLHKKNQFGKIRP